jgi:hypothetical protein
MPTRFLWDGMKKRGHLEGVGVARKIILKKGLLRNLIRVW